MTTIASNKNSGAPAGGRPSSASSADPRTLQNVGSGGGAPGSLPLVSPAASVAALKSLMDVLPNLFCSVDAILHDVAPAMGEQQRQQQQRSNAWVDANREDGDAGGEDSPVSVATAAAAATAINDNNGRHPQNTAGGLIGVGSRRTSAAPTRSGGRVVAATQPLVAASSLAAAQRRATRYHSAVTAAGGGASSVGANRFRRQATGPPPRSADLQAVDGRQHPVVVGGAPRPNLSTDAGPFVLRLGPRPATAPVPYMGATTTTTVNSTGGAGAGASAAAAALHQPLPPAWPLLQSPTSVGGGTAASSMRVEGSGRHLSSAKVLAIGVGSTRQQSAQSASPTPAIPMPMVVPPFSLMSRGSVGSDGTVDIAQRLFSSVDLSTRGGGAGNASSSRMHLPPTAASNASTSDSMARWLAAHHASTSSCSNHGNHHHHGNGNHHHHLATTFTASWLSKTHKKGYLSAILGDGGAAAAAAPQPPHGKRLSLLPTTAAEAQVADSEPPPCSADTVDGGRVVVASAASLGDAQRDDGTATLGSTQLSSVAAHGTTAATNTDASSAQAHAAGAAPTTSSCAVLLKRIQQALHRPHGPSSHGGGVAFSRSTSAGVAASSSTTTAYVSSSKHHYAQDSIFERLASIGTEAHPLPQPGGSHLDAHNNSANQLRPSRAAGGTAAAGGPRPHQHGQNNAAAFHRSMSAQSTSLSALPGRPRLPPSSSVAASVIAEPAGARWVGGLRSVQPKGALQQQHRHQRAAGGHRSAATVPCAPPGSIWGRLYGIAERRMKAREEQSLLLHAGAHHQPQAASAAAAAVVSGKHNHHLNHHNGSKVQQHQQQHQHSTMTGTAVPHTTNSSGGPALNPTLLSPASCTPPVKQKHHHHAAAAGATAVPAVVHRLYERDVRQKEEARIKKVQELELAEQRRLQAERDAIFKRAAKFRDQQQFHSNNSNLPPPVPSAASTAFAAAPPPAGRAVGLGHNVAAPADPQQPQSQPVVVPTYASIPLIAPATVGGLSPMRSNRRSSSAGSPQRSVLLFGQKSSWSVGPDEMIPEDEAAAGGTTAADPHQQHHPHPGAAHNQPPQQRSSSGGHRHPQQAHYFTVPSSDKHQQHHPARIGDDVSYGGLLNSDTDDAGSDVNQQSFVLTPRGTWQRRSTAEATASAAAAAAAARNYKTAPLPQAFGGDGVLVSGNSGLAAVADGGHKNASLSSNAMNSSGGGGDGTVLLSGTRGGPGSRKGSQRGPQHIRTSSYVSAASSPQPKDLLVGGGGGCAFTAPLDTMEEQREEVLDRRVVRSTSSSSYVLPTSMATSTAAAPQAPPAVVVSDGAAATPQPTVQPQRRPEVARLDFSRLRRLHKF